MFWSITTILGTSLYVLVFVGPTIIAAWLDPSADIPHILARYWARWTLFCANVKVDVKGKENIPDGPAVYMSNHASNFDVFAILANLEIQFRWTVKKELFKIPIFGFSMKKCGYIMVDRGNHERAIESMRIAAEKIRSGTSVMIFPEGTRSVDGNLSSRFKKGGFHLVLDAGVPIVPITVKGSYAILPKNSKNVKPGKITINIGKPIDVKGKDLPTLMEAVHNSIQKGFEE